MPTIQAKLGQAIRTVRQQQDMTQQDLSDESGLPRGTICTIERGKTGITLSTLTYLARGLGVKAWTLLRDAEEMK